MNVEDYVANVGLLVNVGILVYSVLSLVGHMYIHNSKLQMPT